MGLHLDTIYIPKINCNGIGPAIPITPIVRNMVTIYKKVRNVDTNVVYLNLTDNSNDIELVERKNQS